MAHANHKNYVKAIGANANSLSKKESDGAVKLCLDDKSIEIIKEMKSLMEWETNATINNALTYFYKSYKPDNNHIPEKDEMDSCHKKLKFVPTFKNKQRISDDIEKYKLDDTYYIIIIHDALKSFYKVLGKKH